MPEFRILEAVARRCGFQATPSTMNEKRGPYGELLCGLRRRVHGEKPPLCVRRIRLALAVLD